jgi:hypothetical protein
MALLVVLGNGFATTLVSSVLALLWRSSWVTYGKIVAKKKRRDCWVEPYVRTLLPRTTILIVGLRWWSLSRDVRGIRRNEGACEELDGETEEGEKKRSTTRRTDVHCVIVLAKKS